MLFFCVALLITLPYFCTAQDSVGSGIEPDVVITVTFNASQNCSQIKEFFESNYKDIVTDNLEIVVESDDCSLSSRKKRTAVQYYVYVIEKDSLLPKDDETARIKEKICANDYLLVMKFSPHYIKTEECPADTTTITTSTTTTSSSTSTVSTSSSTASIVSTTTSTTSSARVSVSSITDASSVLSATRSGSKTSSVSSSTAMNIISTTTEPSPSESPEEASFYENPIVIVPASLSVLLVILIILIVFSMCFIMQIRRIKLKKDKPTVWVDTKPSMGLVELKSENIRPLRPSRVSFVSKGNLLLQTLSRPLSAEELSMTIQLTEKIFDEYMGIPPNLVSRNEIPVGTEDKNRYIDVLPNPNTRVPLFLKFGVAHSDFINANYIRGYKNQPKAYIGTQGPLQYTVADFWRMIWEQKVSVIIMTTELVERNVEKCYQYWPDERGYGVTDVYGDVQVTIRKKIKKLYFTMTTFAVEHLDRRVTREITHYWFNGWPDHGVPQSPKEVVDFLLETRMKREGFTMPGPTVVHCSAGIGRTGVFIAADICMRQLEENMTVDVLKTVATMRQDKGGMVQTKEQYLFLHKVLHDYASRVGHVSNLSQYESDEGNLNVPQQVARPSYKFEDEEDAITTFR